MRQATREEILERLDGDDVVLDIGGWADPFERADWVMDVLPYETRGLYDRRGWREAGPKRSERFNEQTWLQRDICDREPFPFGDGEVDFVICAQTLEDVRDPVWVCSEIERVGKAGYIEVPSRLEEQSWGIAGPFVGWPHHHWLAEVRGTMIEFVFKPHDLHASTDLYLPLDFWRQLSAEERVETLWWEGWFSYRERIFLDREPAVEYLSEVVARHAPRSDPQSLMRRVARRLRGQLFGRRD